MATQIIDSLANIVTSTIDHVGYFGVFFLMLLESCGVPMPSEVIMPFAGFVVATGNMLLLPVIIAGVLGDVSGSVIAYLIGKKGGRPLIEKYGRYVLISKHDLNLADRWFAKHGELTVFLGRLLPVVRTYISFPAGISEMKLPKFILYTFLGALPWVWLLAYLGTKMGSNWGLIREKLHNFDLAIVIVLAALFTLYILRHIKHNKMDKSDMSDKSQN
ncbi:MAG: DedA family protein [bacterium]|nr:DedA family protein [bacterium]